MNVIEKTPDKLYCLIGTCPSVFETDEGTFLIIGKKLNIKNIPEEVKRKIGSDEMIIEIPKNLITELDLFKKE